MGEPPFVELPTYEQSIGGTGNSKALNSTSKRSPSQSLASRLADAQQPRIRALVEDTILPLLDEQIEAGLFQATIALICSDEQTDLTMDILLNVGEQFHKVAKLFGEGNSSSFWRQPGMVEEVEKLLNIRLAIDGVDKVISPKTKATAQASSGMGKRSIWRNLTSSRTVGSAIFQQGDTSWKTEERVSVGGTQLEVRYEEVPIRSSTAIGTYWTHACRAVVVRIQIGQ